MQSAFQKISHILDFTAKANVPLVEDNVREHIDFFKSLLDQLHSDLDHITSEDRAFEKLLDSLQFSFGMNFDDNQLWLKIFTGLKAQLETNKSLELNELMKLLSILEKVEEAQREEGTDSMLTKEQLEDLQVKALSGIASQLK